MSGRWILRLAGAALAFLVVSGLAADKPEKGFEDTMTLYDSQYSYETLYNHPLIFPRDTVVMDDGDLAVLSWGNNRIVRVKADGSTEPLVSLGELGLNAVAFASAGPDGFIVVDGRGLYRVVGGAAPGKTFLLSLTNVRTLIRAGSGAYFAVRGPGGGEIARIEPADWSVRTVAGGSEQVDQLAVLDDGTTLIFSDCRAGRIIRLDTLTGERKVLAEGLGIPGTNEPIAVAVGENDQIRAFDIQGFWWINPKGGKARLWERGVGAHLTYWPKLRKYAACMGVHTNIALLDDRGKADLTPPFNASGIAAFDDGTVVWVHHNGGPNVWKLTAAGPVILAKLPVQPLTMTRIPGGRVFIGTQGGGIFELKADGSTRLVVRQVCAGIQFISGLTFDERTGRLAVAAGQGGDGVTVRIARVDPDTGRVEEAAVWSNTRSVPNMPGISADRAGNYYLPDVKNNAILRLPAGGRKLEVFSANAFFDKAVGVPVILVLPDQSGVICENISLLRKHAFPGGEISDFARAHNVVDLFGLGTDPQGRILVAGAGRIYRISER